MDDVRAAAERLSALCNGWMPAPAAAHYHRSGLQIKDMQDVVGAYLAEHPADDGDALDNEFFGTQWSESGFYFSIIVEHPTPIELRIGPCEEDGSWTVALNQKPGPDAQHEPDDCVCLPSARTRGDVRRLCRALGVELKEGT